MAFRVCDTRGGVRPPWERRFGTTRRRKPAGAWVTRRQSRLRQASSAGVSVCRAGRTRGADRQEVLAACDTLEATWQRILASRQSVLLAQRLLDAERRQFELGLNTSNDVLAAQTELADAQSSEIAALTEYQIALVDMAYATGTVLGAAKLRWEETTAAP